MAKVTKSESRDRSERAGHIYSYDLGDGWTVLAGRSDADNDRLSLRVARPRDTWFHARAVPGSHVILQGPEGEKPSRDLVKRAASIAAYHSKARAGGVVPVSYTTADNVSKPRGAKPGTVEIRKESVVKVRPGLPEDGNNGVESAS